MITVRNGVIGEPDMANRTRMGNMPPLGMPERSVIPGGAMPPPSIPTRPGGGDLRDILAQAMAQGQFSDWKPGPTTPFGGLDTYAWKNPAVSSQILGTSPQGPTAEDLQYLKLFGDQMWANPYRSAGSVVGNRSGRP